MPRRGSFSFRVICGSLVVRIDAASRPITIHRTTITPLGYILAHHILVSPSPSLHPSLSLSLARMHFTLLRAHLSLSFSLSRPSSFLPALLQIARRTYPFCLRKIAQDLNYCALLLSLSRTARVTIRYFFDRDSNYPYEVRIIIYWPFVSLRYSGRRFSLF